MARKWTTEWPLRVLIAVKTLGFVVEAAGTATVTAGRAAMIQVVRNIVKAMKLDGDYDQIDE
jgi:hypothetical protein